MAAEGQFPVGSSFESADIVMVVKDGKARFLKLRYDRGAIEAAKGTKGWEPYEGPEHRLGAAFRIIHGAEEERRDKGGHKEWLERMKKELAERVGDWLENLMKRDRLDEGIPVGKLELEAFMDYDEDSNRYLQVLVEEKKGPESY